MSSPVDHASWIPGFRWWCLLALVLAAGLIGNWAIAAGLLLVLLVHASRPFEFFPVYLLVTAGAAFVYYEGGRLTFELSLLTLAIVLMLFCYVVSSWGRIFTLPSTRLTLPMLVFLALSAANCLRGLLAGHPLKHLGLELIAVLALGSALLVANLFDPRRDLRLAIAALVGIAFGSATMGYYIFSIIHGHTAGVYFTPVPGVVGVLLLNLALRSRMFVAALGWIALSLPLFLHQFLSFRRGLWIACIAAFAVTIAIFAGFGRGSGVRWRRVGGVAMILCGAGIAGAFVMALMYGQMDVLEQAGGRFASIGDTEVSYSTAANFARLAEYATVVKHIVESPVIGHGMGYTFLVTQPFTRKTAPQWWAHQNFLFVWLKQGAIGLVVFLWLLWTGFLLGAREARRREDVWESAWFSTVAAGTAFLAVFSLSDLPLSQVNPAFLLALLWGGAMAMTREGFLTFRWVGAYASERPPPAGVPPRSAEPERSAET